MFNVNNKDTRTWEIVLAIFRGIFRALLIDLIYVFSQQTIICSKSAKETLEKVCNMFKVNSKHIQHINQVFLLFTFNRHLFALFAWHKLSFFKFYEKYWKFLLWRVCLVKLCLMKNKLFNMHTPKIFPKLEIFFSENCFCQLLFFL